MPGFKKLPNAKPIVNITIDEELLKRIEDYQFNNRIPNRSRAFAKILEIGFANISKKLDREDAKAYLIKLIKQL
jgi:metal-responsive CopG/Arc/MetJ family transcriptional regulator